jgi:hypothetical protein
MGEGTLVFWKMELKLLILEERSEERIGDILDLNAVGLRSNTSFIAKSLAESFSTLL